MYDDVISAPNPSRQRRRKRRAAARGTTQVAADTADKAVETESNYLEEAVNTNATISNQENPNPECPKENLACAHAHTQTDICCPNYDLPPSSHNLPSHNLQQQPPEVHPGYQVQLEHPRSPIYAPVQQSQQRRRGRGVRGDSCEQMSVNKKWSDEEYLESQRRMKDLQLQPLSGKINLGFKPVNIKKPF